MTEVDRSRNFIFFGEDTFSLVVLESLVDSGLGLHPLAVVMLEPISVSGGRLVAYCEVHGIALIKITTVRSQEFLACFDGMDFDLVISAHFQRILPVSLFRRARLGALNLHPSLLPRYRGMAPQHWPIILGDAETGVTVHCIDEGVDTGRIVHQVRIPLKLDIYIHELQKELLVTYRTVMVEAVQRLINGYTGEAQPSEGEVYFHKIQNLDMKISLEMDVKQVYGLVRAFAFPYPGAQFQDLRIMKAQPVDAALWIELRKLSQSPSLQSKDDNLYLVLKDGALKLIKWKKV